MTRHTDIILILAGLAIICGMVLLRHGCTERADAGIVQQYPPVWAISSGTTTSAPVAATNWILSAALTTNGDYLAIAFEGAQTNTIDWGDGTAVSNASGTVTVKHYFTTAGTYTQTLYGGATRVQFGDQFTGHNATRWKKLIALPSSAMPNISSAANMFRSCTGLTGTIPDISDWTNVTTPNGMFLNCSGLTGTIPDISGWTKVTTPSYMFYGCTGLTGTISAISGWTNVTDPSSMFAYCIGLTGTIPDISGWTKVTTPNSMFYGCTGLTGTIPDISGWTKVTTPNSMFYNCPKLTGTITNYNNQTLVTTYEDFAYNNTNIVCDLSLWTWRTNIANATFRNTRFTYSTTPGALSANVKSTGFVFSMNACALSQTNVDCILIDLDGCGSTNGTCNLGGTNNPPSAMGYVYKTNLTGKGWTVTVN